MYHIALFVVHTIKDVDIDKTTLCRALHTLIIETCGTNSSLKARSINLIRTLNMDHGLCIEMKTDSGRQNDNQKKWQKKVEGQDYKYIVCRSFDEFRTEVCRYLKFKER